MLVSGRVVGPHFVAAFFFIFVFSILGLEDSPNPKPNRFEQNSAQKLYEWRPKQIRPISDRTKDSVDNNSIKEKLLLCDV